jgi:hypothetical protein
VQKCWAKTILLSQTSMFCLFFIQNLLYGALVVLLVGFISLHFNEDLMMISEVHTSSLGILNHTLVAKCSPIKPHPPARMLLSLIVYRLTCCGCRSIPFVWTVLTAGYLERSIFSVSLSFLPSLVKGSSRCLSLSHLYDPFSAAVSF